MAENTQKVRMLAEPLDLIPALSHLSPGIRRQARETLVTLGRPSVEPLLELLHHKQPHVRWEAAKALTDIAEPSSSAALIEVMEIDEDSDVRWLAAEGLVAMGRQGLPSLLTALLERPYSVPLREGAAHVFHRLGKRKSLKWLRPIVEALRSYEPQWVVPSAVREALQQFRGLAAQKG